MTGSENAAQSYADKTVVVTGASAGIGRATAELFGSRGARVALIFTESVRTELMHDGSNVRITVVQMPAVNTPQFSWVLSRLPRNPQPVPPIYQPEVAAEGVVFAAGHPNRKEYWVGGSTVATILAQKVAAPLLDRYLARTGYNSQQTGQRTAPGRRSNLWQPVDAPPGSDEGAHGEFDDKSRDHSRHLAAAKAAESAGTAVTRTLDAVKHAARRHDQ